MPQHPVTKKTDEHIKKANMDENDTQIIDLAQGELTDTDAKEKEKKRDRIIVGILLSILLFSAIGIFVVKGLGTKEAPIQIQEPQVPLATVQQTTTTPTVQLPAAPIVNEPTNQEVQRTWHEGYWERAWMDTSHWEQVVVEPAYDEYLSGYRSICDYCGADISWSELEHMATMHSDRFVSYHFIGPFAYDIHHDAVYQDVWVESGQWQDIWHEGYWS